MSEELLFEPLTSRFATMCTTDCAIWPFLLLCCNQLYNSNKNESNRDQSKMKKESVKKSLEKSKNVLEEKRKMPREKFA